MPEGGQLGAKAGAAPLIPLEGWIGEGLSWVSRRAILDALEPLRRLGAQVATRLGGVGLPLRGPPQPRTAKVR